MAKEVLTGVKKIVQEVVTPGFNDLKTEVRVNRTKQEESEKRLNDKMDSIKSELRSEMTSNKNEIKAEIRALSEKIDILPRLAILEAQMKEMQRKG
jgi:hypothetical protein